MDQSCSAELITCVRADSLSERGRGLRVYRSVNQWIESRRRVLTDEITRRQACRESALHYPELTSVLQQPEGRAAAPQRPSELDRFQSVIAAMLDGDRQTHRKQRHTAWRLPAAESDRSELRRNWAASCDMGMVCDASPMVLGMVGRVRDRPQPEVGVKHTLRGTRQRLCCDTPDGTPGRSGCSGLHASLENRGQFVL